MTVPFEPWMHSVLSAAVASLLPDTELRFTRDDLYQEGWIMLPAIIAAHSASRAPLEKWTLVCLLRQMRQFLWKLRRRKVEVELPEDFDLSAETERDGAWLDDRRAETETALGRGLRSESLVVLRHYYLDGNTQDEAAKKLGISQQQFSKRLSRIDPIVRRNAQRLLGAA